MRNSFASCAYSGVRRGSVPSMSPFRWIDYCSEWQLLFWMHIFFCLRTYLPFWYFHYSPLCSQQTPWYTPTVLLLPVIFASRLCSLFVLTISIWVAWELVTLQAKPMDKNEYEIQRSSDCTLITNLMHWLLFIHKILFSSTCFEH